MLNVVALVGRVATEPEIRYTPSGVAVCNFRLAVDRFSGDGERTADFFTIVTWRRTAETCGNYLEKGRLVGLQGRLQHRTWENQEGQRRSVVEVVAHSVSFLGSRRDQAQQDEDSDDSLDYEGEDVPF